MSDKHGREAIDRHVRELLAVASEPPAAAPRAGFTARVRARLDAESTAAGGETDWIAPLLAWSRAALGAAAVTATMAIAGFALAEQATRDAPGGWALDPLAWAVASPLNGGGS